MSDTRPDLRRPPQMYNAEVLRETYGQAFDDIHAHLSECTGVELDHFLVNKLGVAMPARTRVADKVLRIAGYLLRQNKTIEWLEDIDDSNDDDNDFIDDEIVKEDADDTELATSFFENARRIFGARTRTTRNSNIDADHEQMIKETIIISRISVKRGNGDTETTTRTRKRIIFDDDDE